VCDERTVLDANGRQEKQRDAATCDIAIIGQAISDMIWRWSNGGR